MFFGFDVSGAISAMSQPFQDTPERLVIILAIAVFGVAGRYLFVAFALSLKVTRPIPSFSGGSMLGVGALVVFALLAIVGHPDRLSPTEKQTNAGVLRQQDSCDFLRSERCVIIIDGESEISVSPLDRRLQDWTPDPALRGPVARSPRPAARDWGNGAPQIKSITWASSRAKSGDE